MSSSSTGRRLILGLPFYEIEIRPPFVSAQRWALNGGAKMNPITIGEHMTKRRLELGLTIDRHGFLLDSFTDKLSRALTL